MLCELSTVLVSPCQNNPKNLNGMLPIFIYGAGLRACGVESVDHCSCQRAIWELCAQLSGRVLLQFLRLHPLLPLQGLELFFFI